MLPVSISVAPRTTSLFLLTATMNPCEFPSFTADLHHLADWLQACGIDTVAMESTGVYWIALYELLDARGLTVETVRELAVKGKDSQHELWVAYRPYAALIDLAWQHSVWKRPVQEGLFKVETGGPIELLKAWRRGWRTGL